DGQGRPFRKGNRMTQRHDIRLGADIGGTFTDIALDVRGKLFSTKVLTELITTEGFRDVIEMRTENRFEQYDLGLVLPKPLIPREDRFPVKGRIDAQGRELQALDEAALESLAGVIAERGFGAVAIGFIHSYMNPKHEERACEILSEKLSIPIS